MMVEQWNNSDCGTEKQLWWNRDGDSDCGTEKQLWWNSGKGMVEQWNNDGGTVIVEQGNSYGVTVEQRW